MQSQRDADFAERMFRYHARLYDRHRIPLVSLAILGDESPLWHPTQFGYEQWGCRLGLQFPTVKLLALDEALLADTPNPIATLTLIHRDGQATRGDPQARFQRKIARYRAMLRQGYAAEDVRRLIRLMEHILRLPEPLRQPAHAALQQVEEEELGMSSFVTSFEEIGIEKGQLLGQQALIMRQLNRKVGELPPTIHQQVESLTPDALLVLSEALLEFHALADLTAWLEQHGRTAGETLATEAGGGPTA